MSLTMESVLDRLQTIQGKPPAEQSPEVRLTIVICRHCGARYWHHLGHMAEGGKIAGGPCCFGHPVLTVSMYPTEAKAQAAWGKWQGARPLLDTQKAADADRVKPHHG